MLCSAGMGQSNRDTLRFQAVKQFKAGSAPGPSGLRVEHLKEIGGRGQGRGMACLAALTGVLNKMSTGKMPKEAAPCFCRANLFMAIKKQGGLRPVAVGEVLRRLCSKCLATKVAPEAAAHLKPLQFGVEVKQ